MKRQTAWGKIDRIWAAAGSETKGEGESEGMEVWRLSPPGNVPS